jgi:hypothetical protein
MNVVDILIKSSAEINSKLKRQNVKEKNCTRKLSSPVTYIPDIYVNKIEMRVITDTPTL